MNARQRRGVARLDQAALVIGVRKELDDPSPAWQKFVDKFYTSVARVHELEFEQHRLSPGKWSEGGQTALLRKRLRRQYMIPLTRTGRRLFSFAPAIQQTLKVPHARASHREIVTAGEVMLKSVRPHGKLLVSEGFTKTFLREFGDLTRELRRIATTTSRRQVQFARVSAELREELASATETLRILDGLVLGRADRDKTVALAWKDAMRTRKPLGRPPAKKQRLLPG
jgi:hypothetical protein